MIDPEVATKQQTSRQDAGREFAASDPSGSAEEEALSEDQQMEAYEDSLKETDWGHQPC